MESRKIAEYLLKIKAVKFSLNPPYIWSSGWQSPIYCDNRLTLSHPEVRNYIRDSFVQKINSLYPETEGIAGVATGAIAQGALIADQMNLPMVYVRSKPKDHGLKNLIEGDVNQARKYVVIEDLISTGGSSVKAVKGLQEMGLEVLGTMAIFSYGFAQAEQTFIATGTNYSSLTNLEDLLVVAEETGYLDQKGIESVREWRTNPSIWTGKEF